MQLTATHHADLEPIVPGDVLISASVTPSGDLLTMWTTPACADVLRARTVTRGGNFPAPATHPVPVRVTRHGELLLQVPAFTLAFPTALLMPGDTVLAVGGRAWQPGEHNAIHYAADGSVLASAAFGDAIEHLATTRAGEIWVGYFDEGTMDAPAGLVRFGPDLRLAWAFDGEPILDCYALNVTDDAVVACYYPDFPLVHIANDHVTQWRGGLNGVRALAVADKVVGLLGGDRLTVGRVQGGTFRAKDKYRVTLPDGSRLPSSATVIGRGPELHFVTDDAWFRWEIS